MMSESDKQLERNKYMETIFDLAGRTVASVTAVPMDARGGLPMGLQLSFTDGSVMWCNVSSEINFSSANGSCSSWSLAPASGRSGQPAK